MKEQLFKLINCKIYLFRFFLFVFFLPVKTASAIQVSPQQKPTSNQSQNISGPAYVVQVKTRAVDASGSDSTISPKAFAGDIIQIRISNPLALLRNRPIDKSKLVLYANGIPLEGIYSDWFSQLSNEDVRNNKIPTMDSTIWIKFILKRDTGSKASWDYLYRNTQHWYQNSIIIDASLGWQGMFPLNTYKEGAGRLNIIYYKQWVFYLWLAAFAICIGLFTYLAFWTDLLHDCGINGPYSLSLSQLLFWTTLVISAFIYTLVLTDIASSLNTSILLLLGISIATTGIASFIDVKKPDMARIAEKKHENFIKDVLTDGCSYSVQRLQIFAWNLVLGIYFVWFTITNKSMPQFSDTLLFLMGVSSASYLGGKVPENIMQEKNAQKTIENQQAENQQK